MRCLARFKDHDDLCDYPQPGHAFKRKSNVYQVGSFNYGISGKLFQYFSSYYIKSSDLSAYFLSWRKPNFFFLLCSFPVGSSSSYLIGLLGKFLLNDSQIFLLFDRYFSPIFYYFLVWRGGGRWSYFHNSSLNSRSPTIQPDRH